MQTVQKFFGVVGFVGVLGLTACAQPHESINPIVILSRIAVAVDGLKQTIRATRPYSVTLMHLDCPQAAPGASPAFGRLILKTRYHEPEVICIYLG